MAPAIQSISVVVRIWRLFVYRFPRTEWNVGKSSVERVSMGQELLTVRSAVVQRAYSQKVEVSRLGHVSSALLR